MDNELVLFDKNDFPNVIDLHDNENPTISSPNTEEVCSFYLTRESSLDVEEYKAFIDNTIMQFRRTRTYKNYKAYLHSIGLDRCQKLGSLTTEMVTIEMHHNILTIFEIALMITEHVLNTVGKCSTFDIIFLLKQEHKSNHRPIVMLSKTPHEMYHDSSENYIPLDMTFGQWWVLLSNYRYVITLDIAYTINDYINKSLNNKDPNAGYFLQLRDNILNYGGYNEYGYDSNKCGYINGDFVNNSYIA